MKDKYLGFIFLLVNLTILSISNAQSPLTIAGVQISFINSGTYTEFTLTVPGVTDNTWVGIGFNNDGKMVSFYLPNLTLKKFKLKKSIPLLLRLQRMSSFARKQLPKILMLYSIIIIQLMQRRIYLSQLIQHLV